jgi:quercetin dioxygenase-like cupin family protein
MIVRALSDVPSISITEAGARDTTVQWLLKAEDGMPTFAMRYFVVKPGGRTPRHAHAWEHELFILHGTCSIFCEGETRVVGPEHAVYIQPDAIHSFANDGADDLIFLCMIPVGS